MRSPNSTFSSAVSQLNSAASPEHDSPVHPGPFTCRRGPGLSRPRAAETRRPCATAWICRSRLDRAAKKFSGETEKLTYGRNIFAAAISPALW
jgi:hypothetical protein